MILMKTVSHKGLDRRSTSHILPNWKDRRSVADMNELAEIVSRGGKYG